MIRNNVRRRTVESISVNSRQRKQWKNLQVRQDLHPPPPLSGEGVGGGVSLFVAIGGGCGGASSTPIVSKRMEIPRLTCSPFLDLAEHNAQ